MRKNSGRFGADAGIPVSQAVCSAVSENFPEEILHGSSQEGSVRSYSVEGNFSTLLTERIYFYYTCALFQDCFRATCKTFAKVD